MRKDRALLEIRAHHLLCLLSFRGLGYNEEFIENMKNVLATAFSDGAILKIVDRCDAICASCPHRKGNQCGKREDSAEKVWDQDRRVAHRLGITIGDKRPSSDIGALIRKKITAADLAQICEGCEWLDYCTRV